MKTEASSTWREFYKDKTPKLRDELMVEYLGLVHFVVNKLFKTMPNNFDRGDLVNIGVIGLSEALDRYNPYFGIKFETYAIPRIRGSIIDELRKQDLVPRSLRSLSGKVKKALDRLEQTHNGELPPEVLTERLATLGISESQYKNVQRLSCTGSVSFDKPNAEGNNLYELIEEISADSLTAIEKEEMKVILSKSIKALPENKKLVVQLYYYGEMKFYEIGEFLKLTESRVSQIHAEAIAHLKDLMAEEHKPNRRYNENRS